MWSRFGLTAAIFATLPIVGAFVPASAFAATVSYQLTVTESTPTMIYGEASPSFRAYLTPPSDDPPVGGIMPFYLTVDSQTITGFLSGTNPYTLYVGPLGPPPLSVGQHSVLAK